VVATQLENVGSATEMHGYVPRTWI
jgi:hypothetical protein